MDQLKVQPLTHYFLFIKLMLPVVKFAYFCTSLLYKKEDGITVL